MKEAMLKYITGLATAAAILAGQRRAGQDGRQPTGYRMAADVRVMGYNLQLCTADK